MPIGIQRLNNPHPQPSSQIVFIKSLPGPDETYARDFLERIAAICHPITKSNHLSIMTLEEHEPNSEFVGRNFNAGEIIQLVLKSQHTGQWLSFRTVQMVMMHELAHCMQMNHSRAFWKVRNQYAEELRGLWGKGYTGDGLWGRGQTLLSGRYHTGGRTEENGLPTHLCGGAYRTSRKRKRKRVTMDGKKKTETYAERQQRRIAKKFGISGQAVGSDQNARIKLEKGQEIKGKPRVANSSRGRELRVAAALARFSEQKQERSKEELVNAGKEEEAEEWYSGSEEDSAESRERTGMGADNGALVQDQQGRNMVRVCGSEDQDDIQVKQEMEELQDLDIGEQVESQQLAATSDTAETTDEESGGAEEVDHPFERGPPVSTRSIAETTHTQGSDDKTCPVCSMANIPGSLLCVACSHVLDTNKITNYWRCHSPVCVDSAYINAADCGLCGVCGARNNSNSG